MDWEQRLSTAFENANLAQGLSKTLALTYILAPASFVLHLRKPICCEGTQNLSLRLTFSAKFKKFMQFHPRYIAWDQLKRFVGSPEIGNDWLLKKCKEGNVLCFPHRGGEGYMVLIVRLNDAEEASKGNGCIRNSQNTLVCLDFLMRLIL